MELHELVTNINDKDDLIKFISDLINDYITNKDSWENQTLDSYLEAMQSWLEDIEGWEKNCKQDVSNMNPWQLIGHVLYASKMYE